MTSTPKDGMSERERIARVIINGHQFYRKDTNSPLFCEQDQLEINEAFRAADRLLSAATVSFKD